MTSDGQPRKKKVWTFYGVLALAILGSLFMVSLSGSYQGLTALKIEATNEADQIRIACDNYVTEYGTLPPTSENYRLVKILCGDNLRKITFFYLKPRQLSPNGEDIDPWGTPFRITFAPHSNTDVISAGPDKIFGTPDDITNQ